jgi:hypothetical protein
MCMYIYVCIYVYIYIYMYIHINIYIHKYTFSRHEDLQRISQLETEMVDKDALVIKTR